MEGQIKKVLVTGSNGLLGQKLISKLSARTGMQIIATDLGDNLNPSIEDYEYIDLDLTQTTRLENTFKRIKPDAVIHAAAMTHVDQCELNPEACHKVNVEATETLARLCSDFGAFLIFVSTDFIFDGTAGPYKEEDQPNPLSVYGHAKWDAEKIVQSMTTPWAIVRTVLLYGFVPGLGRTNIVLWVKKSLEDGNKIKVVNDQERSPTLAEDLADGIIAVLMRKREGTYHISGSEQMKIIDIARTVAKHWNLDESLIEETTSDVIAQPAKRPPVTGFIILRAQTELGYKPHTLKAGLEVLDKQLKGV
jgi:dTDP-4-dehydrorhamnose reductase